MRRAFAAGGFWGVLIGIIEVVLLGSKDIVVSSSLDISGDVWKMPVWSLILAPVLVALVVCFAKLKGDDDDDDDD